MDRQPEHDAVALSDDEAIEFALMRLRFGNEQAAARRKDGDDD